LKTRKLMAVLVMVAMIVTALPVVALAEGNNQESVPYSSTASRVVKTKNLKTDVGLDKPAEFTVRFRDSAGQPVTGNVIFYVSADHDTVEFSFDKKVWEPLGDDGVWEGLGSIEELTKGNADLNFYVKSSMAGKVEIEIARINDEGKLRWPLTNGVHTIDFQAEEDYEVEWFKADENEDTVAAGGRYDLAVRVTEDDWEAVDVEVEFFEQKAGRRWVSIGKDTTDKNGEAELRIRREDADEYKYYVKVDGDKIDEELTLNVVAGSPYTIVADKDSMFVTKGEKDVKFVIKDRYGNKYNEDAFVHDFRKEEEEEEFGLENVVEYEVTNPDGDIVEDEVDIKWDKKKIYLEGWNFDEEGKWEVEVFLKGTSISAKTIVNVGKFGDVDKFELDADEFFLRSSELDAKPKGIGDGNNVVSGTYTKLKVKETDEDGIEKDDVDLEDVIFGLSDRSLAWLVEDGGSMYLVARKDVSGVVTVTATHLDEELEDSVEVVIAGEPMGLDVDVEADDLEATVELTYVDKNGYATPLIENEEVGYRIILPADLDYFDKDDFEEEKATAEFKLEAEDYGTYTVRVVTELGISKSFDVEFVEEVEKPAVGKVLLTLGVDFAVVDGAVVDLDAPAFIDDSRTFVPVRFLAETFGAVADWEPKDAATEVVTLTRDDMEIVIGIGDEFLTVTVDGEVEVQEFDGAARIVNDRTFLPFRAIGEAFGATVDYGVDEEGFVTWVSFD